MRKKQAMLWLLLCGVCVIGGAAYLNKAEPLKAADKSETAQTKQTVPTAKTKAVAKTPAVTQTGEEMVPIGPPDAQYSVLPNFNFQDLYGNLDPVQENRASIPVGFGFTGSRAESTGTHMYGLFQTNLPATDAYGSYNAFQPTDPFDQKYYVRYKHTMLSKDYQSEFHWQRLPKPDEPNQSEGLAFAYGTSIKTNGASNGPQGGLITNEPIIKYNPEETFGFVYGEYELGSANYFSNWTADQKPNSSKSILQVYLKDTRTDALTGAVDVGKIPDLFATPSGSFFKGFTKNVFIKSDNGYDNKYFGIYLENAYHYPIFLRNWMVLMTSVTASPTPINVHLGEDITPYLTETALKETLGDIYYYPDPENTDYDFDDPEGGIPVDKNTLSEIRILATAEPKSNLIGQKKIVIQFKYETPTDTPETKTGVVPVDFNVTAGNSIFLGGTATMGTPYEDNPNLSSLAFSLNQTKSGDYQIAATNGNNVYGDETFNTRADEAQPYYQVDYFAPPADGETLNLNQDLTTKGAENGSLVAVKDSTPNGLISSWGTDGKLDVELGGVLRVYTYDPTKEWLYQNDVLNNEFVPSKLPQNNYVFYQITENGLEPMYNNKVETDNTVANVPKIGYDAPASAVNVAFDSEPDKHLKKINDVDYTGIHFSWNFSRGTTTTDQGKTIDIPASVTGKSMNPDIVIEFPIQPNPEVQVLKEEYETWLPDFPDRWRNSMTESIPKQNAFVMMEMADTEIVDYDLPLAGGKPVEGNREGTYQIYLNGGQTSWIRFKNVGFYEGKSIGVKVSVTPEKDNVGTEVAEAFIGYTGAYFLNVSIRKDMLSAEVQYDFFDSETYEPVLISSYWTVSNLNEAKLFTVSLDEFINIYSINQEYEEDNDKKPIAVKYSEDDGLLTLIGTAKYGDESVIDIQRRVTFTLRDTDHFKYKMTSTDKNPYVNLRIGYESQTDAFVEIPDPVGEAQVFDTITADNYPDQAGKIKDPLNIKFYQYIPYESERNRGKSIEWTLPAAAVNESVGENGEWIVTDETDTDVSDRFTIDEDSKMVPRNGLDESFYNHYYFFQKNLVIDDQKPIEKSALSVKDEQGHRYFDYRGEITLEAQGFDPVSSEFYSKINFAAEADFEPVYRDSEDGNKVKPVPGSSTQTEKNLLITHKYTEVTPPPIDGYEYADESIPENYTELPVRYTQAEDNKVQLVYAESIGELFFNIPEEMNFQKVSIPTVFQKTEYLQTIDPDWAIKVTDERSEKQRTPWKLSAQIADQSFYTHTDSEYQGQKADSEYEENIPLMSNILRFANADGATNDLTQSVVIYDSGDEPQAYNNYPIQWTEKNTGFFLDLQAYHYYPLGKYKATIDFTVEYVE